MAWRCSNFAQDMQRCQRPYKHCGLHAAQVYRGLVITWHIDDRVFHVDEWEIREFESVDEALARQAHTALTWAQGYPWPTLRSG